jgi:phosphoribosylanthranilate isomerase
LAANLGPAIQRVGVFVDPADEEIAAVLAGMKLDLIQLHGSESPERLAALKDRFRVKLMKAIAIAGEVDLQRARAYLGSADWLMFDAKPPPDDKTALPGGNGRAFDWQLLRQARFPVPWMLSGGLTPDNLAEAVRLSGATTVDVSSGVERCPGEKDPAKIRAFLARAKEL